LLKAGDAKPGALVTSELSLAEVLVKPLADERITLASRYGDMIQARPELSVVPVDRSILILAAHVRKDALLKDRSIKLPDAIHLATAEQSGCGIFLSDDKRLDSMLEGRRVPLSVTELDRLTAVLHEEISR
jgi:predicted nucleic acid-binding protein